MAEFLTTSGIAAKIEQVFRDAKKEITIVSPYLQVSPIYLSRLNNACDRNVVINFICREPKTSELEKIKKLKMLNVYSFERLHAKCYYNENEAVLGSMNLYDYSVKNNWEMGVSVNRRKDRLFYEEILREVDEIKLSSKSIFNTEVMKDECNNSLQTAPVNSNDPLYVEYQKVKENREFSGYSAEAFWLQKKLSSFPGTFKQSGNMLIDFPVRGVKMIFEHRLSIEIEYNLERGDFIRYFFEGPELLMQIPEVRRYMHSDGSVINLYLPKNYKTSAGFEGWLDQLEYLWDIATAIHQYFLKINVK